MSRVGVLVSIVLCTLVVPEIVLTQTGPQLVARRYAEVELVYGKRSVIFDLDKELMGANGSMPGSAPHTYKVLFSTEKNGFLYLVANVRSRSPISNPMAPCGGDAPQAILWIKADKTLLKREVQSEIYESCSYNYRNSRVTRSRSGLIVDYGDERRIRLEYDNLRPELGLVVKRER